MDGVDLNTLTVLASIASLTTLLLTATVVRQYHIRKALRLSEEKFSKAVGFSPDAVTISHLSDGCFIEVNDSFSTLTGYSRSEALGRTSIELRLWDDPGGRQALLESLKQSGTVRNQEIAFRHKDGRAIHTLLSTAVFNLDNRPCLLTVARDVTDWKLAQARLQRLAERDRLTTET
ncbi:MAG: PAS domain S-box protein, partial [Cyanobacteria bacterium P01_A01_bin.135]